MEIVSEGGSKTQIKPGQTRELGRDDGLNSSDKTISRRHVSLFIPRATTNNQEILLQFEVLGRNPIYVSRNNEVEIFRRFERGEMGDGDMFCVSAKNPIWCTLRKLETENCGEGVRRNDLESELAVNLESVSEVKGVEDLQHDGVDISNVDLVKEFGFVVIGHEFDSYPKNMIRDIKNWDWFLEEAKKGDEEDEDDDERGNKSTKRKRNKGNVNDDEEWTGESEDNKVVLVDKKSKKGERPKYVTRSKDHGKPSRKDTRKSETSKRKGITDDFDDDEDENENVDTLGGFIVDDEKLEDGEDVGDEEDEEEEFVDEYDEDD